MKTLAETNITREELENLKRPGIRTYPAFFYLYHKCEKHGKVWREGEDYEEFGGRACKECVEKSWTKKRS